MAELTIIGWVVSPIIESMITTARSYIERSYLAGTDLEDDLQALQSTLNQVLAVVGAAERHWIVSDASQQAILREIKDVAYKAEDLLDECDYLVLQAKVKKDSHKGITLSSLFTPRHPFQSAVFRTKVRKVIAKMNGINSCAERFLHLVGLEHNAQAHQILETKVPWRATSSFLLEDQVFGRDKERSELIELLLNSEEGAEFVLPVVGDGGVGKTTLAQLVYNDENIVGYFDLRIWVCVSDKFSEIKLIREILASTGDERNVDFTYFNLNKLQEELQRSLANRRFLLVLDDVWFDENMEVWENRDRWRKFLAPLQFGRKESKILATTRIKLAAKILGAGATNSFCLNGLEDDEFWLLFKQYAFGSEDPDSHPELKKIGKLIAKNLKGLPLGAKVVGGMLIGDFNVDKWKSVLQADLCEGIMPVLRLTYQNLPTHLQRCFAYCSIFPRDWKYDPDRMVYLWMAQGFIQLKDRKDARLEDVGRTYFDDLLARSFFQKLEQHGRTYYLMHELMNDLARTVSKYECFRIEGNTTKEVPPTVRHLSVNTDDQIQMTDINGLKSLRTLLFLGSDHSIPDNLFKEMTSLRVLDLVGCDIDELPNSICNLIHLRYLSFCDTLDNLPPSLCQLYHLQVINASRWCWFGKFPDKMKTLINLRHLNVCSEYVSKIPCIGNLTCLQELAEFHVSCNKGFKISELKNMNELQGSLCIKNLELVKSKDEASKACLCRKEYLKKLQLEWTPSEETRSQDVDILEGLKPHRNLEELDIVGYRGLSSPEWLNTNWLCSLKAIYLTECTGWEFLPPFGQLPCLKVLKIRGMHAVKQVGSEFYGTGKVKGFPSLEYIRMESMPKWVEWHGADDYPLFPSLRMLEIRKCPNLKGLPSLPSTLSSISVREF